MSSDDGPDLLARVRNGAWLDSQQFPPLQYAIPGLIPEGATILIGPPKAGKSYLLVDLLLAKSAGGYALGKIPIDAKATTLYLALEDSDRRMQERCRELLHDEPIPPLFHYVTTVHPRQIIATITAFLDLHPDTALVVLDTLGKCMPEARPGESAYQRDYRIAGALKGITDNRPGLSLVVVHHDRKAASEDFVDSVSGTNGLAGAMDTIMVLVRKRQSADGILKVTGRDVPESEFALTVADGHWTLDGTTLAAAAAAAQLRAQTEGVSDRSAEIIAFVAQHPDGVRAHEVEAELGADARRYLARLVDSGRLDRPSRGLYTPVPTVPVSQDDTLPMGHRDSWDTRIGDEDVQDD